MPDTKIIKQSLQYRAKYKTKRQPSRQTLMCWQLDPHPSNRGGEGVRALRTKVLVGDIIYAGYDSVEASVDAVAVEIDVDPSGCASSRFSDHFQANPGSDPDHDSNPNDKI